MIYGIISKRKSEENPPHDLLQLLIEAKYEDGSCMTDEQIRDEVMTVFLAGHETTVNALSWTWYSVETTPGKRSKNCTLNREAFRYGKSPVASRTFRICVTATR
jgi:cytochrome P450